MKDPEYRKAAHDIQWDIAFHVSNAISDLRVKKGLKQTELAEMVGTKQPAIARAENGSCVSSLRFLNRIAKATGMKLKIEFVKADDY